VPDSRPRVTVVGGGVIGLLTAWECAREGAPVTLVDAAGLPNRHGASYDQHRIMRALHPRDTAASAAAVAAAARWADLAGLAGRGPDSELTADGPWLRRCGVLTLMAPEQAPDALATLAAAGAEGRLVAEPGRLHPPLAGRTDRVGVLEPGGGVLLADRILRRLSALLAELPGVTLRTGCPVTGLDGDSAAVRLADGTAVAGDRLIVAAGPWSLDLLPPEAVEGLTLYRQTLLFCDPAPAGPDWASLPAVPALDTAQGAWLVPPVAGTALKLTAASACRAVERIDGWAAPGRLVELLSAHFTEVLTGFRPDWVTSARDAYYLADTATHGPRLAELGPGRAWAFAACGGGAFKTAPLVARALAERALDRPPTPTGLAHLDRTASTPEPPLMSGI
jgi:glycine/D-amino acid oxidase-like deaminating enzyme